MSDELEVCVAGNGWTMIGMYRQDGHLIMYVDEWTTGGCTEVRLCGVERDARDDDLFKDSTVEQCDCELCKDVFHRLVTEFVAEDNRLRGG